MNINSVLKANGTTSKEFAAFIEMTEQGLCRKLKSGKLDRATENNLKMFLMEKRGIKLDVSLKLENVK